MTSAVARKAQQTLWIAETSSATALGWIPARLMLTHAFEVLKLVRVQFQTDELNHRSRTAILRLGAVEEGVLLNERTMPDGRRRNSVRYSIIDSEWPAAKAPLIEQLC